MLNNISYFVLILVCLICAYTDWKTTKIYNKVTYPAIVSGLLLSLFSSSFSIQESLLGIFGSLLLFGFFWGRGLGAGDIKLLIAIGALQGFPFVIFLSFYVFALAGIFSIFHLAWNGRLIPVLRWVGLSIVSILPGMPTPVLDKHHHSSIPFAPFILAGAMIAVYLEITNGKFSF